MGANGEKLGAPGGAAINNTPAWRALVQHRRTQGGKTLNQLFAEDGRRFEKFSLHWEDFLLDFSKTHLTTESLDLLAQLAETAGVESLRERMFRGEQINSGEGRRVLHTALRDARALTMLGGDIPPPGEMDGLDVSPMIDEALRRQFVFAEGVRDGTIAAAGGDKFSDIVTIGVGGSHLGALMATAALHPYHDGPRVHFVSNADGADIQDTLSPLDVGTTLIIIVSKTFATSETMINARTAKRWLQNALGGEMHRHLAGATAAASKAHDFGLAADRIFPVWDFVGGRYSVWSAVGLPLLLAVGRTRFAEFLRGGHAMDEHFCGAEIKKNLPFVLGLAGIWHRNFCGYPTRAVLPYDERLKHLPVYLQQLDMESNGKSADAAGEPLSWATAPVVWGAACTGGQHSFFQLLHQGADVVPCEFVAAARGHEKNLRHHHNLLLANCLAQSRALMSGDGAAFAGDRPSVTLLYEKLTPHTLGRLMALFEHRAFVEGAIWGINSFDQPGVELGKQMAARLEMHLTGGGDETDASTRGLLAHIRRWAGD